MRKISPPSQRDFLSSGFGVRCSVVKDHDIRPS